MESLHLSLSDAEKDSEYIIKHIGDEVKSSDKYSGYGIQPGAKIKLLFRSPSGDPAAYEIMGTVLALRKEDSDKIYICGI